MTVEPIRRREIADPFRAFVQEHVAQSVERDPAAYLAAYCRDPRSFAGRYVCADLVKETLAEYRSSPGARNFFNTCVHNTAAVLAAAQLRAILRTPPTAECNRVMLLSGIPGAGKTSAVLAEADWNPELRAIFEGQLSTVKTTFDKLDQILAAGYTPVIAAVHTLPERALANTLQRFNEYGRGAGIGIMAEIQAGLPDCLAAVRERYRDTVSLLVIDRRGWPQAALLDGWAHLETLRSEGTYEQIHQRLAAALERIHAAEPLGADCYRQAHGHAPAVAYQSELADTPAAQHRAHEHGRELSEGCRQAPLLTGRCPFPIFIEGAAVSLALPNTAVGEFAGPIRWADTRTALQSIGRDNTLVVHDIRAWSQQPRAGDHYCIKYRDGRILAALGSALPSRHDGLGR